ncbi:hypothetical protein N7528_005336 [Penicillium herquei]|nr:hypothetical protein N7528_005336 [Penicillium herquei]
MEKRSIDSSATQASTCPKRPKFISHRPFQIINLKEGETVYQTCILVVGECSSGKADVEETTYISVAVTDCLHRTQPSTHWTHRGGYWTAVVILTPGANKIKLDLHRYGSVQIEDSLKITVNYVPLLQLPPLHLAILVAKDSPLLIDCPPAKYGAISTAHSSLDAAISKFRMTAYMWQALTAEYFREKEMGRRSFRLDEEWTVNTTSQTAHQAGPDESAVMGMVAKVHIIRCEKSVAEIRDMSVVQKIPCDHDRDALHRYFEAALLNAGAPFEPKSRPVVAGLILDAHYSADQSVVLGHAALGCRKPNGISLGIFGSHFTYSWPRFLQEVPACLTDLTPIGHTILNNSWQRDSMGKACSFSQSGFLHQVGHAFGARHTSRIMNPEHTPDWAMSFIENHYTADMCVDDKWDLRDAYRFRILPHFALPGDLPMTKDFKNAAVKMEIMVQEGLGRNSKSPLVWDRESNIVIKVSCSAGLADVHIPNLEEVSFPEDGEDMTSKEGLVLASIEPEYLDPNKPWKITALGMNGMELIVTDVWTLLERNSYFSIPRSEVRLRKRSIRFEGHDEEGDVVHWAMLLHHRGKDGQIYRALCISLQVEDTMNEVDVHYADGHYEKYGPALEKDTGQLHVVGQSSKHHGYLAADENITKVLVRKNESGGLAGFRATMSNGDQWGFVDKNGDHDSDEDSESATVQEHEEQHKRGKSVFTLEPAEDEVIVGFYGQSGSKSGFIHRFGILTAPKDVKLPETVYDLPEFNNCLKFGLENAHYSSLGHSAWSTF